MSSMQEMTKLFDAVETVIQKHYNGVTFPKVTNTNTAMLDIRIEVHGNFETSDDIEDVYIECTASGITLTEQHAFLNCAQMEQVSLDELDKRLAEYTNKLHDVTVSSVLHAHGPALRRVELPGDPSANMLANPSISGQNR